MKGPRFMIEVRIPASQRVFFLGALGLGNGDIQARVAVVVDPPIYIRPTYVLERKPEVE